MQKIILIGLSSLFIFKSPNLGHLCLLWDLSWTLLNLFYAELHTKLMQLVCSQPSSAVSYNPNTPVTAFLFFQWYPYQHNLWTPGIWGIWVNTSIFRFFWGKVCIFNTGSWWINTFISIIPLPLIDNYGKVTKTQSTWHSYLRKLNGACSFYLARFFSHTIFICLRRIQNNTCRVNSISL